MSIVKKHWVKTVFILVLFAALYIVTRLPNLTKLPIFTDEAIYIRWSQIGSRDPNWRFISLVDGKQPLFTWILMVLLRFFKDPLFAGRFVSVLAGAVSTIGIGFLSHELFKDKKITLLSILLYLLSPFALMYDRLALYDSLVAALSIWNLYLAIRLVKKVKLDIALLLGMTLGLGMLNKTSGFFSLYLLPFTILLFDFSAPNRIKRLFQWMMFILIAGTISQLMYGILRLSPLFNMIAQKDTVFVYPFREWFMHPFTFLEGNIKGLFDWLVNYLTVPIATASFITIFTLWKRGREKLLLYIWWFAPFLALALFGKVLYPRFILFMVMPLLILASTLLAWFWDKYGRTIGGILILIFIFWTCVYTDYFIITNPLNAPIPYADKGQLIDNWPAGWGIPEVNTFLQERSKYGQVTVYTEGTFGLLPAAIEIYLVDKPNIEIHGIWPLPEQMPMDMRKSALDHETYFVMNETQKPPLLWSLSLLAEYQKGNRADRKLRLFRVLPHPTNL